MLRIGFPDRHVLPRITPIKCTNRGPRSHPARAGSFYGAQGSLLAAADGPAAQTKPALGSQFPTREWVIPHPADLLPNWMARVALERIEHNDDSARRIRPPNFQWRLTEGRPSPLAHRSASAAPRHSSAHYRFAICDRPDGCPVTTRHNSRSEKRRLVQHVGRRFA